MTSYAAVGWQGVPVRRKLNRALEFTVKQPVISLNERGGSPPGLITEISFLALGARTGSVGNSQ